MMILKVVAALFCLGGVVALAELVLKILDRITLGKRPTPDQLKALEVENARRLLNPKYEELERRLGTIPIALRELYENTKLIQQSDFSLEDDNGEDSNIVSFEPADAKTLDDWERMGVQFIGKKVFPFAHDGCGDCYAAVFTPNDADDCAVYFWDHEGGGFEAGEPFHKVADSLREFLRREIKRDAT